ncbi:MULTISPECIES: acyl-CoA dehydrogenase family protein [unclassified Streptomyces]|uniref:acyl-CoA dehydrogenase family protein n=1 Tax=unclassified Streptomyces TaxID=2593676 RepID=UPI002E2B6F8B|nr:acyl-CoA dehydrogenase family protein [Streptomyces sp. NBC_00223]
MSAGPLDVESVESFRDRARRWLKASLPPAPPAHAGGDDDARWARARVLQKQIHEGGFAGICFPREYGGLGLTPAHQRAFTEESLGYEMPLLLNVPTFSICAPTILDMGTEEQKLRHLPAVIRGDEVLVQFLSEPKGGSDLAGLITRADRDGDEWVVNGSKIWSSGAYAADYALCLARTDWDAPKHRGLTMFLMPVHAPGVTINRIKQVNGSTEFCQEFFDDVVLPADAVVGEVNGGWATASRQLFHERNAVGGGSPYTSGAGPRLGGTPPDLLELARATGQLEDPRVREQIGEVRAMKLVQEQLIARVTRAIGTGAMEAPAGSVIRLFHAESDWLEADVSVAIAGATGVTGEPDGEQGLGLFGVNYLFRQGASLGGGSTEMSRNIISERVLKMPREFAADRDMPFKNVKQGH